MNRKTYSKDEKLSIIQAYLSSGESMERFQNRNGLGHCTLSRWMTIFALDNPINGETVTKKNEPPDRSELKALKAKEMALESEISRLKAELKAERLKAEAYSVMIDVAEEQFGVDIRKKAGAKQ